MQDVSLGGVSRVAELENILGALIDAFDAQELYAIDGDAEALFENARQTLDQPSVEDADENE